MKVVLLVGGPPVQEASASLIAAGWTVRKADNAQEVAGKMDTAWVRAASVFVCDPASVRAMCKLGRPVVGVFGSYLQEGESSARWFRANGAIAAVGHGDEAALTAVMNAASVLKS